MISTKIHPSDPLRFFAGASPVGQFKYLESQAPDFGHLAFGRRKTKFAEPSLHEVNFSVELEESDNLISGSSVATKYCASWV
jgi:hypothetical protein